MTTHAEREVFAVCVRARLERDLLKWTADYSRNERTGEGLLHYARSPPSMVVVLYQLGQANFPR